jgi:hypothetical protein
MFPLFSFFFKLGRIFIAIAMKVRRYRDEYFLPQKTSTMMQEHRLHNHQHTRGGEKNDISTMQSSNQAFIQKLNWLLGYF